MVCISYSSGVFKEVTYWHLKRGEVYFKCAFIS
jgi:hypothetical protein